MNILQFSLFQKAWDQIFDGARKTAQKPLPVALAPLNKGGETVALAQTGTVAMKPRIINIRDAHSKNSDYDSPDVTDAEKDHVLMSQLTVIQELRKHPGCPVLVQSLDEDLEYRLCEPVIRAKHIFRNGIPTTIEALNYRQKEFIYEFGGAHLLLYLNEIPVLHKTLHKEVKNSLAATFDKNVFAAVSAYEREVVECSKEVFSSRSFSAQEQPTVVVVSGAFYDLSAPCLSEQISYEQVEAWRLENISGASNPLTDPRPRVIHVGQMHRDPYALNYNSPNISDQQKDNVIRSQLEVVQTILRNPGCPVLDESLDQDMEYHVCEPAIRAERLFPEGIPSSIEQLNYGQKEFIYEYGAPELMLYLKKIPALYKTIHKEVSADLLQSALAGSRVAQLGREKEAIACAKEVLSSAACASQVQRTVLVVFGSVHNFAPLCREANLSHEMVVTL